MQVHVATMKQVHVNAIGVVIDKSAKETTYNDIMSGSSEWRVDYDSGIASTGNPAGPTPTTYPTLKVYLEREAALGFMLQFLNQSMVITYLP